MFLRVSPSSGTPPVVYLRLQRIFCKRENWLRLGNWNKFHCTQNLKVMEGAIFLFLISSVAIALISAYAEEAAQG